MTKHDAYDFGQWCREENSVKKTRVIKSVFDRMLEKYLSTIFDSDYDGYVLFKEAYEGHFNRGYYEK